jgi:homoserine O-acetyltransferase
VGIASDLLFPVSEQEYLAAHIPDANLVIIDSLYGHDGFLIETAQLSALLKLFLINQSIELSYGH